ncbi:MAG TPA: VOC family protein [Streptomyces sp.]
MPFTPCISVRDTAESIGFYMSLGFEVDSSLARPGDDVHMLLYQGEFCGLIRSNAELKEWLPQLAGVPVGMAGVLYLTVDDFDEFYERVRYRAGAIKGPLTDELGQRVFYFRDMDKYVIGVRDRATLRAGELGRYA